MEEIALNNEIVNTYFRFLKNLDLNSKKTLIIKLTESIKSKKKHGDIKSLFGAWKDDRPAEDIIEEINENRTYNREIEDFE